MSAAHRLDMLHRLQELTQRHGEEHPYTRSMLLSVADYTFHYKLHKEAAELYTTFSAAQERALGEDHPGTLCARSIMLLARAHTGENVVSQLQETVKMQTALFGTDDECVQASSKALAYCSQVLQHRK
jgi:hypothetical protein